MTAAESRNAPLTMTAMDEAEQKESRTLMFILSGCLAGGGLQLAMNVGEKMW